MQETSLEYDDALPGEAQKMEAIGQLAGRLAHDFNNLLTIIAGYSTLLTQSLRDDDTRRGSVQEILRASDRALLLTRQLLILSGRQPCTPQALDLNELIAGCAGRLRSLVGTKVTLSTVLASEAATVCADPEHMQQVLAELASNARDAMEDGGALTIQTGAACISVPSSTGREARRYVVMTVADTGCGMSAEVRAHAFEPFFTTKSTEKRAGLGLATVYGMVKQAGGKICLTSQSGAGSRFTFYFPALATRRAGRRCESSGRS
jgi:signal transduction histidine kinase